MYKGGKENKRKVFIAQPHFPPSRCHVALFTDTVSHINFDVEERGVTSRGVKADVKVRHQVRARQADVDVLAAVGQEVRIGIYRAQGSVCE